MFYLWHSLTKLLMLVGSCSIVASTERVTVRLPADKLQLLQSLVDNGSYDNLSDAIRDAVDQFLDNNFTPDNISKVTVDLPKGNVLELESLIRGGDSVSMDDAIRNAVREYTRSRVKDQS